MSDVAFNTVMGQIDDFTLFQKKALIKALKKSVAFSLFQKKSKNRTDRHLLESLVGVAGNSDTSVEQIRDERLSGK